MHRCAVGRGLGRRGGWGGGRREEVRGGWEVGFSFVPFNFLPYINKIEKQKYFISEVLGVFGEPMV